MCSAGQGAGIGETGLGAALLASGFGAPLGAGLIASGVGTGLSATAQQNALDKQNQIAAQGIIKQGQLERQGDQIVKSTTNSLAQSNANTQAASAKQLAAYQAALENGAAQSKSASPTIPGASKAYSTEQARSSGSAQDYVNAIANSAATTEGTQLERVGEGETMGQAATNLGQVQGQSNEQNYLTKLQTQSVQANPWMEAFGTALQAAGAASMGAGALGAGAGAGSATVGGADAGSIAASAAPGGSIDLGTLPSMTIANPAGSPGVFGSIGNYLTALNRFKPQNNMSSPYGN